MYLDYFKYLLKHKWYVLKFGWKLKVPFSRLVFHDLTKFYPSEFFPYADWFYGHKTGCWDKCGNEEVKKEKKETFEYAWNLHQKRNPHHYQYWAAIDGCGDIICLEMPDSLVREMVADWISVGYTLTGKNDVKDWYSKNRDAIKLHPKTREMVCKLIGEFESR